MKITFNLLSFTIILYDFPKCAFKTYVDYQ